MIERLQGFFGFTHTPFGRDLAPGMLHRHASHGEAVARIGWCVTERRIGVITGEVGAGKTVAVRAALSTLDPTRNSIIYLPNPTVGVRGIHHQIVLALGGNPLTHHATWSCKPRTCWPPNKPNAAAPPCWSSSRHTCSTPPSSRPSACSQITTWTPTARLPACSSVNRPCDGG